MHLNLFPENITLAKGVYQFSCNWSMAQVDSFYGVIEYSWNCNFNYDLLSVFEVLTRQAPTYSQGNRNCVPIWKHSVQFSSVAQSCPTLCDPMNRSTPGLPVHHQLPEFTQTHIHRIGDAIQPSRPLSFPSPPALNPSQHQSLFQWVNSLHKVARSIGVSASASVPPTNIQDWHPLEWTG